MPRPGSAALRRESAASGVASKLRTGLAIRALVFLTLALGGFQGWSSLTAESPTPSKPVVPAESIAAIQITLGQAALALRDFGKEGLLSDRFDFEQGVARVRRSLEALDGSASEAEEQKALDRAKTLLERLSQIEKEHIARIDAGRGPMGPEKLAEIATLRDDTALALTSFREVGLRRTVAAEPDPIARMLRGAAGAGAGLLSLCIGAVTLWSRLFPA